MRDRLNEHKNRDLRDVWEIQDTLLQGFQGLLLTFHVAAHNVPPDHAAKALLDHALASADQVISDARRRIEQLDPGRSGYSKDRLRVYKDQSGSDED